MEVVRTRRRRGLLGLLTAVAVAGQGCLGLGMYTRPGVPLCSECAAEAAQLDQRVVLIGDAGEDYGETDVLRALTRVSAEHPDRTLVLFLGDNVYPLGLPPRPDDPEDEPHPEREPGERILATQVAAVEQSGAEAVLIPGNHDWARTRPTGMARVIAQGEYVAEIAADPARVRVLPRRACPGPIIIDRGDTVRVLVSDTVWLLEQEDPRGQECEWGPESAPVPMDATTNLVYYDALVEAVQGAGDRRVLFAAHHPLRTRGPHGGHITIVDMLFPFTLLRSWIYVPLPLLYPVLRYTVIKNDEDLVGDGNILMVGRIEDALRRAPGGQTVAAGGHEHSLQVFDDPLTPVTYLVSGAGSKDTPVGTTDNTVFKQHGRGFMVLDYFRDGRLSLRVIEADGADAHRELFGTWIE